MAGVLILHGFLSGPSSLAHVAAALHAAQYTVAKPVLRGHGAVPADLHGVTWFDWLHDAQAALHTLTAQTGAPATILGYSLGGLLALQLAAAEPAQVESLILAAPALEFRAWLAWLPLLYRWGARSARPWRWRTAEDLSEEVDSYTWTPLSGLVQLLECSRATHTILPQVTAPVCIFQGGRDEIVHPCAAYALATQLPGNTTLTWFPRSGHRLYYGPDRETLLAKSLGWLQGAA